MKISLISKLRRVYELEQQGVYDAALLYDVCWDFRLFLDSLLVKISTHRGRVLNKISTQFDTPDAGIIDSLTSQYTHELFLFDTLESHLKQQSVGLKIALHGAPEKMMLAIDSTVDSMHVDYPLLSHLSVAQGDDPLLTWIATRRGPDQPSIERYGLRKLFSR